MKPIRGGLLSALGVALLLACAPVADGSVRADFDGDGRSDLAIGAPRETLGSDPNKLQAGAVQVLYGAGQRLGLAGNLYLSGDTAGILGGGARLRDEFGGALAAGDFDGDGYADLAIGVPSRQLRGMYEDNDAGAVHILYGGPSGLTTSEDQYLHENSPGIKGGEAGDEDLFGYALAAGDFNRDGRDDLAIGAPGKVVRYDAEGAVHILHGGRGHLRARHDQYLTTQSLGFGYRPDARFGRSLAAGDLSGDRRADLVVGSPFEQTGVGNDVRAGAVRILLGGADRLRRGTARLLTEDTEGMAGSGTRVYAQFGHSLAIGRFNEGRRGDLAIGVPGGRPRGAYRDRRGTVHVLYGGRGGPSLRGDQYLSTLTPAINGSVWDFGYALASLDLNGDGRHELAIGSPAEDFENLDDGAVHVLYGGQWHLSLRNARFVTQDTAGMAGDGARLGDLFGFALGGGDFDGDGRADLAIGEPHPVYYDQSANCYANGGGGVHVVYGARSRLSLRGNQYLTQDTPGMAGDGAEECDMFGSSFSGASR